MFQIYPNLENILKDITINIFLLNLENKEYNSITMPASTFKQFSIFCYYLKDNDEYKHLNNNPIYIFLHEFGHVLSFIITKKNMQTPDNFLEYFKLDSVLTNEHPNAQEVFADFFAISVMYRTKLNKYNVFAESFPQELFSKIGEYFTNLIENYENS